MNPTIERILQLSGDMPDRERYRMRLEGLSPRQLEDRLRDLEEDALKRHRPNHRSAPKPRRAPDLFTR